MELTSPVALPVTQDTQAPKFRNSVMSSRSGKSISRMLSQQTEPGTCVNLPPKELTHLDVGITEDYPFSDQYLIIQSLLEYVQ